MNKKIKISVLLNIALFLGILKGNNISAQDSIRLHDDILLNTITENPYLSFRFPVPEYTLTEISYGVDEYSFSRKQVPNRAVNVNFGTQGILKPFKNLTLSGKISFDKIQEQSVSYILDNDRTTERFAIAAPYYYVGRAADWKKQNYHIKGVGAYHFAKNFVVQASAEGKYSENFRNLDARPEINIVNYDVGGKVGYSNGNHAFMIGGGYQNLDKSLDIYYQETLLNNLVIYPETFLRRNEGYGNNYIAVGSSIRHLYKNIGNYFDAEYSYAKSNYLLRIGYRNLYNFTTIYNDFYKNPYHKIMALKNNGDNIFVDFHTRWENKFWTSHLEYISYKSINYNYISKASSNKQTEQTLKVKNRLNISKDGKNTHYGLDVSAGKFRTQDLSVALDKSVLYTKLDFVFGKEFPLGGRSKLGFSTIQSIYIPVKEVFNYQPFLSSQENVFVKNIAQIDHFYDTSYQYAPQMELFYQKNTKKLNWQVYLSSQQRFFVENNTTFVGNKNSNLQWKIGIRIFY